MSDDHSDLWQKNPLKEVEDERNYAEECIVC